MKPHVTEEQLIQWLFDLADSVEAKGIAAHVAQCDACTALKMRIEQTFSQLDVLKGDPILSEAFIDQTVTFAQPMPVKRLRLWWISAAACLFLAGLITMNTLKSVHRSAPLGNQVAKNEVMDRVAPVSQMKNLDSLAMKAAPMAATAVAETSPEPELDPFAKQPFAPASAIELVTLPRRENVQVTIYNQEDLTLVREQRSLTLKRGWNWLQFMWANTKIDPTSLDLQPKQDQDKVTIKQLVYPAGLKDIGRWLIRSEVDGQVPFELTYFTSGLSWRAVYMGTLSRDEMSLDLKSYVRVDNRSGEDFDETQVRLVLGEVQILESIAELAGQNYAFGRPEGLMDEPFSVSEPADMLWQREESSVVAYDMSTNIGGYDSGFGRKEVAKKTLSEYVLYTIEGTEDLVDQWGKRLLSFEANDVPVESLYKYDETRWGMQTIRFVSFANDSAHNLGKTPLPQGQIKLFGQASTDGLTFVGDSEFKYIPVNQEVTLDMGPARYVKVEPTLMAVETTDHTFDPNGNLNGFNETQQWQVEVTNTRSIPVKIEIMRDFDADTWTMDQHSDTIVYEKYDTREARFTLTLAPKAQRKETYTVTTYHGQNNLKSAIKN